MSAPLAERCTIETAELILGLKRRNIQARAARGEIPGAGKIGHLWTFDVAMLRRYVRGGSTMQRKAPAGCFWRGDTLWGRIYINGREIRRSLQTNDAKIAAKRRQAAQERVIADKFGDATRDFVEVVEAWSQWITRQVGHNTAKRYACSLDQIQPYLDGKMLSAIDGRLVSEIAKARASAGATNATIKRDLVALSSVINFAIDQGWCEDNPVLPRMGRLKERRDPIVLPQRQHIDLVISRCPGMVADVVKAAMATGARQDELLKARQDGIDRIRRQLTIIGKGNKQRVIDLDPFGGYALISALPVYAGKPLLFWHSDGESYKNFARNFGRPSGRQRHGRKQTASISDRSGSMTCGTGMPSNG